MSTNSYDTTSAPAALAGPKNENELSWQKAYKTQRPKVAAAAEKKNNDVENDEKYFKAQQANQITLQQIKDEKLQREQQQKQQWQHATPPTTATITMTTSLSGVNKKNHQDDVVEAVDVYKNYERKNNDYHNSFKEVKEEDDDDDDEVLENENEHLLSGQEQQQNYTKNATQTRANLKATNNQTSGKMEHDAPYGAGYFLPAGNPNKYPAIVNPLGSKQEFNAADFKGHSVGAGTVSTTESDIDLITDCKLELQKLSKEMMQSENNINEQNSSTIILNPTLLTSKSTTATEIQNVTSSGGHGGDGGHNKGGTGEDVRGTPVANFTSKSGCCDNGVYKGPNIWQYLVKHYPVSSQPLAIFVIFLLLWCLGYILMPDYAEPHTGIMRIAFLFVGAQLAGILVTSFKLPDMLGMLFFGVFYTNIGWADFSGYQKFESFLRDMALINIMLLAGLGLDANAFKKLWFMILRLTLLPTIAEVAIIAVLAHFILQMPWLWGILLGLVITAVSPNVVVTVMLKLKEERLGLNSGIHTLIYAMTTCNDVVAIFLFGVISGVIFSTGSLSEQILQGPVGIGIGIVFGGVYGILLTVIPSRNAAYVNGLRFVLTILGGTIAVLGSKAIGYPSAGALGCVTVAFVAGIGWKRQMQKLTPQQLQAYENANVGKRLDLLWKFLKPVSFSLIGKEINFAVLDGKVVGYGVLIILLGSVLRLLFAYLSTYGGNLTRKERGYITISGFPKATVQAALGPIALDYARSLNAVDGVVSLASNVLIISVLAIILTAPLGAILMLRLAPVWLQQSAPPTTNNDNVADDNRCRGNLAANLHMIESAGNINLDHNQKTV